MQRYEESIRVIYCRLYLDKLSSQIFPFPKILKCFFYKCLKNSKMLAEITRRLHGAGFCFPKTKMDKCKLAFLSLFFLSQNITK